LDIQNLNLLTFYLQVKSPIVVAQGIAPGHQPYAGRIWAGAAFDAVWFIPRGLFTIVLQTICLPVGPRCDICALSSSGLCPSAKKGIRPKNRKALALSTDSDQQIIPEG